MINCHPPPYRGGQGWGLQVRVDLRPLSDGRYDVQRHELVAHLAEVLIAGIELGVLLGQTLRHFEVGTRNVEGGLHGHHDVVVFVSLHIGSDGEAERFAAHSRTNHLNREIRRTLETGTATQLDDGGTTLGDVLLHLLPLLSGELRCTNDVDELATGNLYVRAEHSHLLAVTTIGGAALDLALLHTELLGLLPVRVSVRYRAA